MTDSLAPPLAPPLALLARSYWIACRRLRSRSPDERVAGIQALGGLLPRVPPALATAIHRTLRDAGGPGAAVVPFTPRSQVPAARVGA